MTVRAKFVCQSVTQTKQYDGRIQNTFKFNAVYGGGSASDENKKFWESTPSGTLELSCIKEEVTFELGQEYYIDITKVE